MRPDINILSILNRYENDQPVSAEEKAVLHTWLIQSLYDKHLVTRPIQPGTTSRLALIRKNIRLWQYAFIFLTLLAMALALYLFVIKKGQPPKSPPNGNFHGTYQKIWKTG